MPEVRLDAGDAAELAEMLQFLTGWLARDPARLAASLEEFAGHPAYGIGELHQDLERRRTPLRPTAAISSDGSTILLWPQRDTVPGRFHDQVRVEAGLHLADASSRPFADEGHRPGRWQRAGPVTPVPVTQPTTETLQIQRNTDGPGTLVQLRPAAKVRGLPAISELHAEMNRFMRCHLP